MKKYNSILLILLLSLLICSCGSARSKIAVVTREDGSGTRSAFAELLEIKDTKGRESISDQAEVTNSTAVMITSVSGYKYAVGYVSIGSLSDTVKAVAIEGITPTAAHVKDSTYPICRSFNLVTKGVLGPVAQDFMQFVLSKDGQKIVEEEGFVSQKNNGAYEGGKGLSGKISVAGSTSVAPVLEAIADAYREKHPAVSVEIQQTGSSAGIQSVSEGVADIGMSSRELTESEKSSGLLVTVIALDGIAVIVNQQNPVSSLKAEQVRQIFDGGLTDWTEVTL